MALLHKTMKGEPAMACQCCEAGRKLNSPTPSSNGHKQAGTGWRIQPNHRNPFLEGGLMNLTISGHHLEVTPSIREYVLTKLDRVTRHFDQVVDIAVLLTVEKQKEKDRRQRAEVNLHVKGRDIFVETAHEDLYAAIDELVDKLDRQVCRHKSRVQDHHHVSQKREMLN